MATNLTIRCETLKEIKKVLASIKDKKLTNKVMTEICEPSERYVQFDAVLKKVDNLLENCNEKRN